jgi:hypothetical protein
MLAQSEHEERGGVWINHNLIFDIMVLKALKVNRHVAKA